MAEPVEEHAQRVAAAAVGTGEDEQHIQPRHREAPASGASRAPGLGRSGPGGRARRVGGRGLLGPCLGGARGALDGHPLQRHHRERVGDASVHGHRQCLLEGTPLQRQVLLGALQGGRSVAQVGGQVQQRQLVGDRVGDVDAGDLAPLGGGHAGLLLELAPGAIEGCLGRWHAALGDLERARIEGVAVLRHQRHPVVLVERHDAHGQVGEMDDAVDAGAAVGPRDLIVVERQPRVLVCHATAVSHPWADRDRGLAVVLALRAVGHRTFRAGAHGCVVVPAARPAATAGDSTERPPSTVQTAPVT